MARALTHHTPRVAIGIGVGWSGVVMGTSCGEGVAARHVHLQHTHAHPIAAAIIAAATAHASAAASERGAVGRVEVGQDRLGTRLQMLVEVAEGTPRDLERRLGAACRNLEAAQRALAARACEDAKGSVKTPRV